MNISTVIVVQVSEEAITWEVSYALSDVDGRLKGLWRK